MARKAVRRLGVGSLNVYLVSSTFCRSCPVGAFSVLAAVHDLHRCLEVLVGESCPSDTALDISSPCRLGWPEGHVALMVSGGRR